MTLQLIEFESLNELVQAASEPACSGWTSDSTSSRDEGQAREQWAGTRSFSQAVNLAREGWAEGLGRMQLAIDAIAANAPSSLVAAAYDLDVAGAYPIAALAAAGSPLCMVNPAPVADRARPVLRLATSVALPAQYEPSEVFAYGAGLIAVIDALEQAGFSVELSSVRCNHALNDEKIKLTIKTLLKPAGQPLELERLAFCLAHAAYNRRLHFGVVEARCKSKDWAGTYGYARKPEHGADVDHDVCVLPGVTMFPASSEALSSPAKCFDAMLPAILELLRDRFAAFPELHIGKAA